MPHRQRWRIIVLLISFLIPLTLCKSIVTSDKSTTDPLNENFENNIIDFDEDYSIKFNKKYGVVPWDSNEKLTKEMHRYTLVKDNLNKNNVSVQNNTEVISLSIEGTTSSNDYSVIPLELLSTTEDELSIIIDSTTEQDLTVIPLRTTTKAPPVIEIKQTVTLPTSTQTAETTTEYELDAKILTESKNSETTTIKREITLSQISERVSTDSTLDVKNTNIKPKQETKKLIENINTTATTEGKSNFSIAIPVIAVKNVNTNKTDEILKTNTSMTVVTKFPDSLEIQEDVPSFSELDTSEETEVPEDYYDNKDVIPTPAPKNDALSVIFGLAGSVVESVVESVAERVVPKSLFDLFKRMQRQNEALEAEKLRSREENGGIGQFGRGILKSISNGISKPLSQIMQGVRDIGSLDSDRGFVSSVASGVSSVATSVADAFKDRVQAIYPGTVWCGDGHSATARSSDLGLFFFTDTCCRQHDACKIYIKAGDTKYGLTNTGLFTRSHCSCDAKFRDCLHKTNSLVSAQIGLTYFNVLGPQCFRKAHPIVKCVRRTRITGQKCEEYELDYTKPKMWQWFDNETF